MGDAKAPLLGRGCLPVTDPKEVAGHHQTLIDSVAQRKSYSYEWRKRNLLELRRCIEENQDELQAAIKKDLNKGFVDFYWSEINHVYQEIQDCLDNLHTYTNEERRSTDWINMLNWTTSCVRYDPYGVVLIMTPWNYPYKLMLQPLAGAIASGNCVWVKGPDSNTIPHTSNLISNLLAEYLDPECIKIALGDVPMASELLKQRFDLYYYTGGPVAAKFVARAAAEWLAPTVLELGGQSPCVIDETISPGSYSMNMAAKRVCWGCFSNAGQVCVSVNHIIIHEDVADAFIAKMKENIVEFYGPDVAKCDYYGRIVRKSPDWDRLNEICEADRDRIVRATDAEPNREDRFMPPTILDFGTDWGAFTTSKAMEKETFGCVIPLVRYNKSFDWVVSECSKGEKPLSAYIFSTDSGRQQKFMQEMRTGAAVANDVMMQLANYDLPWGGVGHSGHGKAFFCSSRSCFSQQKAVMYKTLFEPPLPHKWNLYPRFPPYNDADNFILKLVAGVVPRKWILFGRACLVAMLCFWVYTKLPRKKQVIAWLMPIVMGMM